jgi:hypothetical protein
MSRSVVALTTRTCSRSEAAATCVLSVSGVAFGLFGFARRRQQCLQQLQLFRHQSVGEETHAGDIAARPVHAIDEAELHGISADREHDGNGRSRGLGGKRRSRGSGGDDYSDSPGNQLGRKRRQTIVGAASPTSSIKNSENSKANNRNQ